MASIRLQHWGHAPSPPLPCCSLPIPILVAERLAFYPYCKRATENAWPKNDGVENEGQIPKELQSLENAGMENNGQTFSNLRPKLRGLENVGLENDGQTFSNSVLYM